SFILSHSLHDALHIYNYLSLTEILNSFKAFSNFKPPLLTKGKFPFTFNGISILYFVPALSNLLFSEYTWPAIINRFAFSLVSIKDLKSTRLNSSHVSI